MNNIKRMNKKKLICNIVSIIVLLLVCILVDSSKNLTWPSIISKILIFTIAALALNLVCGCLGEFALGHGGFLLIGYTVAVIVSKWSVGLFADSSLYREIVYSSREGLQSLGYLLIAFDVIVAALLTGVIGFLVGIISLGRLKGDYLAIVTLGISLIFVNICRNFDFLGGAQGFGISTKLGGNPIVYAIWLVISVIIILMFMKSRYGRGILAIREDNIASEACGIPVNKYKVICFTVSAVFAGLAGALYAHFNTFRPVNFSQDLSIELLVIVVLGGIGSLTGTGISAFIIVLYNMWFCTQTWVPEFFKNNPKIIYGIILVTIMLFRSSGILGTNEFSWDWFFNTLKKIKKKILSIFRKKQKKDSTKENTI